MNEPHTHGGTDAPECTTCRTQSLLPRLTAGETKLISDAFYASDFGEEGYFGRPECDRMAAAVEPAVLEIKRMAFQSGVNWKGEVFRLAEERDAAVTTLDKLRVMIGEVAQDTTMLLAPGDMVRNAIVAKVRGVLEVGE